MPLPEAKRMTTKEVKEFLKNNLGKRKEFDSFFNYIMNTNYNQQIVDAQGIKADADKKILNMIRLVENSAEKNDDYKNKSKKLDEKLELFDIYLNTELPRLTKENKEKSFVEKDFKGKFFKSVFDGDIDDIAYWQVLALKTYSEKKKEIKPGVTNPGELSYKLLRESIIAAKSKMTQMKTMSAFNRMVYNNNNITAIDTNTDFNKLNDLLKSGDSKLRGSSKEYKEIQKELKQLTNRSHLSDTNTFLVNLQALVEKTDKYIRDRKSIEMNYSPNSYKGKRVAIMREINAVLSTIATRGINNNPSITFDKMEKTNEIMKSEYSKSGFTVSRFKSQFLEVKSKNLDFNMIVKNDKGNYIYDEKECETKGDVLRQLRNNLFNGKEEVFDSMSKLFDGKNIDFETSMKAYTDLSEFYGRVEGYKKSKDIGKIGEEYKNFKAIKKNNQKWNVVDEAMSIYEKFDYGGKILGSFELDTRLNNIKGKIMRDNFSEELGDLVKTKPVKNKPDPIKNIHFLNNSI